MSCKPATSALMSSAVSLVVGVLPRRDSGRRRSWLVSAIHLLTAEAASGSVLTMVR